MIMHVCFLKQVLRTLNGTKLFLFLFIVLLVSALKVQAENVDVTLSTNLLQKELLLDGVVDGHAVKQVKCILDAMHLKYQIQSLPWRRARQNVNANAIDGFFTAAAIGGAGDDKNFSAPLMLENWYWFWRSDETPPASWKEHFQVGVIMGSQQETLLANAGYTDFVSANNLEQLVKLLFSKRVDVVLFDKDQFESALKKAKIQSGTYNSRFFRYVPMGVYFSSDFLVQHAAFLDEFNGNISRCTSEVFDLSDSEQAIIKNMANTWFQRLRSNADILSAVAQQNNANKRKTDRQLKELDAQWQTAFGTSNFSFYLTIINLKASQLLRQFQQESNSLLSEIIAMDERGYNVAITGMTSDYWQGDEDKFVKVFTKPEQTLYVDKIIYDSSSKRFQVQVSAPLFDSKTQKHIGVITLGIDVDKALSQQN